jgi:6-phosphogluconolactonase
MKNAAASAGEGHALCEARYRSLALPFDELVLGMGEDGHIASLFPNARGLAEALDMRNRSLCAAVMAPPGGVAGTVLDRMSLTLHGLLSARRIDLLVTGDRKLQLLLEGAESDGGTADLPVCHILRQRNVPVRVWWAP